MREDIIVTICTILFLIVFFFIATRGYSQECPTVGDIYGQITCEIKNGIKIQIFEVYGGIFWLNPITIIADDNGCYSVDNLIKGQQYGIFPQREKAWHWEPDWEIMTVDNDTSTP